VYANSCNWISKFIYDQTAILSVEVNCKELHSARSYAKSITTSGLWIREGGESKAISFGVDGMSK